MNADIRAALGEITHRQWLIITEHIAAKDTEIARLKKDAARYRVLRKMQNREWAARILTENMNVDAVIDDAMQANNAEVKDGR